ncbi:MAG TPA: D-alanyl-D-alanine carboxypeptidase [Chitinophagaceae bacterium]|nr:D-alanyl-D-alanine carboxypeptidase [Chitinophagaceae bacterium]
MKTTNYKRLTFTFYILHFTFYIYSCSVEKKISHSARENVLGTAALKTAQVGISIFEPATHQYWFNYQGDHYFVPASNTKIPTCYAAMKYLGDSLTGLKYAFSEGSDSNSILLAIQPTGDPSFLHPDFQSQPVWNFLQGLPLRFREQAAFMDTIWKESRWGSGWSWNDYDATYMAERSVMPVYGNVMDIQLNDINQRNINDTSFPQNKGANMFRTQAPLFDSMINNNTYLLSRDALLANQPRISIRRDISKNDYWFEESGQRFENTSIPFVTDNIDGPWLHGYPLTLQVIRDRLHINFGSLRPRYEDGIFTYTCPDCRIRIVTIKKWNKIHSQATDSLLKPMMHRSDNFFAEQSLLMVSNEKLGFMSDEKIIDTLLKTDFKDLPQKPRWVDGSGLSRYNLFSPQDFVTILNKMKNEFGMERIKTILATGGEGTISSYYKADSGYIYAKTGTLSGVVALSGFLYTKKNKLLIFSALVNNHTGSATDVRRAVEKFIEGIRNNY